MAVNTVILASDDMRELLPHGDSILKKCVDPLDAFGRSSIKWTRSAGKRVNEENREIMHRIHHIVANS